MAKLIAIEPGYYRIPLPQVLTDSTHGEMRAFELNTVRVRDADGAEGVGYTYTVGRNGAAIDAILRREFGEIALGAEADAIEALWQKVWWGLHYGGRGGPSVLAHVGFRHGAVGPEGEAGGAGAMASARRVRRQSAVLRRRHRPGAYARMSLSNRPRPISPRVFAPSR